MTTRDPFARRLPSPLPVKGGPRIATIADARAYILTLPPGQVENQRWQRAVEMMLHRRKRGSHLERAQARTVPRRQVDLERME